jgi:hypothetical protein
MLAASTRSIDGEYESAYEREHRCGEHHHEFIRNGAGVFDDRRQNARKTPDAFGISGRWESFPFAGESAGMGRYNPRVAKGPAKGTFRSGSIRALGVAV